MKQPELGIKIAELRKSNREKLTLHNNIYNKPEKRDKEFIKKIENEI